MKQQNIHLLKLICLITLGFSLKSHSQTLTANCGNDIHGVGEVDLECPSEIIVTSTPSEGTEGTIIQGLIYSSYSNVRFIPGHSKVRFIPYNDVQSRGGKKSKSGTGGKPPIGGRYSDPNLSETKFLVSALKLYPNPVTSTLSIINTESDLISYEVYSIDGRLLLNNNIKPSSKYHLNLEQLKSGLHLLKLYMKNGDIINKHIIKH